MPEQRDLSRFIANGTILEGCQRRLDLAKPSIDLVRQLVGAFAIALELCLLGGQGIERNLFGRCESRAGPEPACSGGAPNLVIHP
jgi:hypothetical protein